MSVDEIITLDDNKEYILLFETVQNENKYFLAVEAINEEPSEKYTIFKEINENNEICVEEVEDKALVDELIDIFEQLYDEEDSTVEE